MFRQDCSVSYGKKRRSKSAERDSKKVDYATRRFKKNSGNKWDSTRIFWVSDLTGSIISGIAWRWLYEVGYKAFVYMAQMTVVEIQRIRCIPVENKYSGPKEIIPTKKDQMDMSKTASDSPRLRSRIPTLQKQD